MVALAVAGLAPKDAAASGGKMYWIVDPGFDDVDILRANLNGGRVEEIFGIDVLGVPLGVAVDAAGRKMYWTDISYYTIERANLDGSGREVVTHTNPSEPFGIALDVAGGKMYWTVTYDDPKIQRANLNGTGVEDLVAGLSYPTGIALDVAGGKMYWTDSGKIQRANLDGRGMETLVTGLSGSWIALDVAGGKMYWTGSGKIQRANLDGTGVEDVVTGLSDPAGIALDVAGGKMYWTDYSRHTIQRANLDGTGMELLVAAQLAFPGRPLMFPWAIALDLMVGGSATGFQPIKVVCSNVTTGQPVKIIPQPGTQSWDCAAAGLGVNPRDRLKMAVRGSPLDLPVGGSAINFEPSTVVCRNLATGQRVKLILQPVAQSWDCTAAGLVVSPGDLLKMTVRGLEP